MTRKQALEALASMGITGKMAAFLLDSAQQHGAGAHLKCDVTYAAGLGYVIVDHEAGDGNVVVDPGAGGYECGRPGCPVTVRHGHGASA